jgi:hypothetical protein
MYRIIALVFALIAVNASAFFAPNPVSRGAQPADGYEQIRWQRGWSQNNPGYLKREGGMVSLHMSALHIVGGTWSVMVLPRGFRPTEHLFNVPALGYTTAGRVLFVVHVYSSGEVVIDQVIGSNSSYLPGSSDGLSLTVTFPAP